MNEIQARTAAPTTNAALEEPRLLTADEVAAVAGGPEIKNDAALEEPRLLTTDEVAAVAGGPEIKNGSSLVAPDDDLLAR